MLPFLVDLLENHLKLDEALRDAANELATPSLGQRREEYPREPPQNRHDLLKVDAQELS